MNEDSNHHFIIAIDGPAGSGKSTIARRVADRLAFTYVDSGAMYRCVALWALRTGQNPSDHHRMEQMAIAAEIVFEKGGPGVRLNGEDVTAEIRTPEVSRAASEVAVIGGVRRALVAKQRAAATEGSIVMEGRDIGTVVFPEAKVKIFLDADPAVRATRRTADLAARGGEHSASEVEQQIRERDQRDRTRTESPLLQAPDAQYVDTSGLEIGQVEEAVLKIIRERISNGKEYR